MAVVIGRRCPSVAALMHIKDVTEEDAQKIRHTWRTTPRRKDAREQIDQILRTHGIEFLGIHRCNGQDIYYCNAGDTYATTILFVGMTMKVGTWGDLVEANLVKDPNDQYR